MSTTTREASRPLDEAPKDHTMIWLLVDYSGDGANPLEDEILGWTIGHNGFDDTGVDEWEFAGWSWEQDCFTQGFGKVVGWHPLQRPDQQPATEPQGYAAGLEAAIKWLQDAGIAGDGKDDPVSDCIRALVASPDQPAADTRVVTVALLDRVMKTTMSGIVRNEIRAIIDTATPAPSDKIAEAARALLDAPDDVMTGFAIDVMRANRLRDGKRIGYQPAIIAALRALAGKGE